MNFVTLFNTKVLPAVNAALSALPGLISTEEVDVQAALTALEKASTDFQAGIAAIIAAVKNPA